MEKKLKTSRWDDHYNGSMSEYAIRNAFVPQTNYQISKSTYPSGTSFPGAARPGTCFVVQGACRYCFGDDSVDIAAGEFAELPEGEYTFCVIGDEELVMVRVWQIPF